MNFNINFNVWYVFDVWKQQSQKIKCRWANQENWLKSTTWNDLKIIRLDIRSANWEYVSNKLP